MRGYGFSVWLLPRNRGKLIKLVREMGIFVSHIPHVTVKTNFTDKESAKFFADSLSKKSYPLKIHGGLRLSAGMYEFDPLDAWIFPAKVPELEIESPHLSVQYMKFGTIPFGRNIYFSDVGDVVVADTESLIPRDWRLCYFQG